MKIYLLDINKDMTDAWSEYFGIYDIEIINQDFVTFMNQHPDVDGIVSPANSFGLMDGGYDKAIIDYLGERAQTNVLTMLSNIYNGYQPVGTCLAVPYDKYIILHTPTMRTPETIIDSRVIYDCMHSCLLTAKQKDCKSIVIPAFGGLTGKVPCDVIAKMMFFAYQNCMVYRAKQSWEYALYIASVLKSI